MGKPIPNIEQTMEIIDIVKKKKNIKFVSTRKWASYFKRRKAARMLKSIGLDVTDALKERFIFQGAGKGGYLLCPRKLGWSGSSEQRVHDLATLAHEVDHRNKSAALGHWNFSFAYTTNSLLRAFYEMSAECASADVYQCLGLEGEVDPDTVFDASWQDMYKLRNREVLDMKREYAHKLKCHQEEHRYIKKDSGGLVCRTIHKVMK